MAKVETVVSATPVPQSAPDALAEAQRKIAELTAKLAVAGQRQDMENIKATLSGSVLTIVMDLSHRGERSSTGKTRTVASTHGNRVFDVAGERIHVGVNAYVK